MPGYDLHALKVKQERFEDRKKKLLDAYIPFRDGLFEELELFTKEAAKEGLQGVKPCKRRQDTNEILEAAFTLNNCDLVLVATDTVSLRDMHTDALAAKMFIYYDEGCEDNKPIVKIEVWESGEESYAYDMSWFTTEGPQPLARDNSVNKYQGQRTAGALVNHFYSFKFSWVERPTLGAMLSREVGKRSLGFLQE